MTLGLHTTNLNFKKLKNIGQEGKNSKVYLAYDIQLDAEIIVKEILKSDIEEYSTEYFKEAKILYHSAHPNVVQIHYSCEDNKNIYLAMPYYRKGSLKTLIDSKFLTVKEVLRYSIQFLLGLNNIHSKKLIHFDVKPGNVLISDSDVAMISDFGLSKAMNRSGLASPNSFYGRHSPPESLSPSKHSLHYDIYSAGSTIYRLVNGNKHFENQFNSHGNNTDAILSGRFPDRNDYLEHVPVKLRKVINKALERDKEARHQNVIELINELNEINEDLHWLYSVNGSTRQWTNEQNDKILTVTLESNGDNRRIITTKKIKSKCTRIRKHCHDKLTKKNYISKLRRAFKVT